MKLFKVDIETNTVGTDETYIIVRETLKQAEEAGWEMAKENTDSYGNCDDDEDFPYEDTYCAVTEITNLVDLEDAQATMCGCPSVLSILKQVKSQGCTLEWVEEAIEYLETELKVRTRMQRERQASEIEAEIAKLVKSLQEIQELLK